jgi:hypothetical protein
VRIATGRVVGGKVVVEGDALIEGTKVVVLAQDEVEAFEVSPEQEEELVAAIAEADRGEFVSSKSASRRPAPLTLRHASAIRIPGVPPLR